MNLFDKDFKEKDNLDLAMDDMDISGEIDIDGMSPEELAEMGIELDDLGTEYIDETSGDEIDLDDDIELGDLDLEDIELDDVDLEDIDSGEDDEQN